jgi:hypothetical protein
MVDVQAVLLFQVENSDHARTRKKQTPVFIHLSMAVVGAWSRYQKCS